MSNKKFLKRAAALLQPIDSSNITRIGYDKEAEDLYVEFQGGRIYVHHHVPEPAWDTLNTAPSKGACYNKVFKGNAEFPFEKLDTKAAKK